MQDAFKELSLARSSPKQVRRAFSRSIELTQRLTSVMRRESKAKAGIEWRASEYTGWNDVTALFKDLRNEEQHERQIRVSVHETRYYEPFGSGGGEIAVSGTWELTDQLAEKPPDGLRLVESDPNTGIPTSNQIPHCGISYRYVIQPQDARLVSRLQAIGTADIHELSHRCFTVLEAYHTFFRTRMSEAQRLSPEIHVRRLLS